MIDLDFATEPGGPADPITCEQRPGFSVETWRLTGSEGDEVRADLYVASRPGPVIILGHGRGNSRKAPYVKGPGRLWAPLGMSVAAIDAPLHGDRAGGLPIPAITSAEPDLLVRWVRDHRLLIDAVLERFGSATPLAYVGFSMGGVFGTHLVAADPRLGALVTVVTGSTLTSLRERMTLEADLEEVVARLDPVGPASRVAPRPTLMANADDDEIFSSRSAWALYDALSAPKEISFFPGRHGRWRSPHQWFRRIGGFLTDTVGGRP